MTDDVIPLAHQDITQAEIDAVVSVLQSDRLSLGPQIPAFEAAVASRVGRKYGIAVNSGTSGLHLCVKALGIGAGDEVITTPFSFVATTNCLLFENARPVLVDIDPVSYNLDPAAIEAAITDKTKAILPVEVFGNPACFDAYDHIARKHNLILLEDCCEALGATIGGRPAGSFGEAGVFAFYPNKQITTGEGGMIVTDDEKIRDLCVSWRNQGRATEAWLAHARLGYNYRMSDVQAAIGVVQMQRLDELLAGRRRVAAAYDAALGELDGLHLPPMHDRDSASWFVYVIRLGDEFSGEDRDAVLAHLQSKGVSCSNYFVPIHTQPYIMDLLGTAAGDFPLTEHLAARTIALPFHTQITDSDVARAQEALSEALASRR